MSDLLVRAVGWPATVLHGDPCVLDRFLWVRRRLGPPGRRTLDAGAGNGAFTIYAARRGDDALGLSFSADELEAARRRAALLDAPGARFEVGDLRELDALAPALGTFDRVLCLEVAEHIRDDAKLVRDLAGLLRPGGRLLLTTPSAEHPPLWRERLSATEDGGHVRWGYTHPQMAALLEQAGLRVLEAGHVSGIVSQRLTNVMRRAQRVQPAFGWAVTAPLRVLQVLDRPLTRLLRRPWLCIAVVAARPAVAT